MTAFFCYFLLPFLVFQGNDNLKLYEIKKAKQEVNITGKGSDPIWDQAAILTDFQLAME